MDQSQEVSKFGLSYKRSKSLLPSSKTTFISNKREDKNGTKIKIISKETIKPSSPTPSHLKTYTLSFLDQEFPTLHNPLLLFYTTTPEKPHFNITTLKTSHSETLSHFYPLAGRCIDDSHVSCNDEGVPLIETFVNYNLKDFLSSSNKLDMAHKFLPPRDSLPPLAFQINVFACDGVVIRSYRLHKLLDGASLATFFQFWAAVTSKQYQAAIEPNFDALTTAFPPWPKIDHGSVRDIDFSKLPIVTSASLIRSFRFTNDAIGALKGKATSEAVPRPTSFESIVGFIWDNIASAAYNTSALLPESSMALAISMNMRPHMKPPLPKESVGNCVTTVLAKVTGLKTFPCLVTEIHEQIIKGKSKIEKFQGENGIEEFCLDKNANLPDPIKEHKERVYYLTSWCKLGLNEADFGFGKPSWILPTEGRAFPLLRNIIMLTEYNDSVVGGGGIEVWLFLEENEMRFLESNQQFLDYASPN